MKKYYVIPISVFIITATLLYGCNFYGYLTDEQLIKTYGSKLQIPLFTGFLTISGFLLSLTTFIVVKMHEAVYQDEHYFKKIEIYTRIDENYSHTKPLENLSSFLISSVVAALITSFSQFTIGNYSNFYIIVLCLSLAACASTFVFISCLLIKSNITIWIGFMKEKKWKDFENSRSGT